MEMILSLFKKKQVVEYASPEQQLRVDMHSHLLPGIDDGLKTIEESLEMLRKFAEMGYKKLIMTPHVMSDFYKNTPEIILRRLNALKAAAAKEQIDIELEAAAEYYLDEFVMEKLEKGEELLTFGDRYLLFETSFINACAHLENAIFLMQSSGYKPVLAHPERYVYWFGKYEEIVKIKEKGIDLQVNINSLMGYYSKSSKKVAEKLIDDGLVSFLGTDCHGERHMEQLEKARLLPHYHKAILKNLKNNSLL